MENYIFNLKVPLLETKIDNDTWRSKSIIKVTKVMSERNKMHKSSSTYFIILVRIILFTKIAMATHLEIL